MSIPGSRRGLFSDGCLLLAIFLVTMAMAYLYVTKEHTFYYWDYSAYHDMAVAKAVSFRNIQWDSRHDVLEALKSIWKSTRNDYSDFHTLFIVPFICSFGVSRLVYILSMAVVFLLPFSLLIGAIAGKLIPTYSRPAFWSTSFLALFIPGTWVPTLRGYPDAAAAALIALALWVYLIDPELKRWWRMALIGFIIALAILFRRHFIYGGISFYIAVSLKALIDFAGQLRQHPRDAASGLVENGARIGLTAASTLITLALIGWPFIDRVLHTDFGQLYASYQVPVGDAVRYYGSFYGSTTWILAGLGIAAGIQSRVLARSVAVFIVLFISVSLLQWMLTVKQLGVHYTMHFTLLIVLGLASLGWTAWIKLKGKTRMLALSAGCVYIVFNLTIGLGNAEILRNTTILPAGWHVPLNTLFAARYPPLRREDYSEIVRLIDYLRTTASAESTIYIAASSDILNDSLVWHAERALHEDIFSLSPDEFWRNHDLNVAWSPIVDSRDYYPIEKMLQSQFVVVAFPFQHHLRPEEQDVVKVVVDAFAEDWEIVKDFKRLPERFFLADGIVVDVYKRIRATPTGTAIDTLRLIRDYVGERPGGQPDWISLNGTYDYYSQPIVKHRDNSYDIQADPNYRFEKPATSFLYLDQIEAQVVTVGGSVDRNPRCKNPLLRLSVLDSRGQVLDTDTWRQHETGLSDFSLAISIPVSGFLLLETAGTNDTTGLDNPCAANIRGLTISSRQLGMPAQEK